MMSAWRPNPNAPLWDTGNTIEEQFFPDIAIQHDKQIGPSCVATTLAMIARTTGAKVTVDDFKKVTNSQSPHSWSNALKPYGMQLAYCNTDLRRIEHYIEELVEHDDLFLLSFYSVNPPSDPDETGKLALHTSLPYTKILSMILPNTVAQEESFLHMIMIGLKDKPRESSE